LESIGGVSNGNDKTSSSSKSKEKTRARSLNTCSIGLSKVTKPRSRALRSINAFTTLSSGVGFYKVGPLNAKNIGRSTIRGTFGMRNGKVDSACFAMGIKLASTKTNLMITRH
jgi:hypothetical protein